MQQKQSSPFAGSYLNFRRRLQEELERRKARNSRFSLRSFARFLAIDPASLQKLLVGKRPLGERTIRSLGKKIHLTETEILAYIAAHRLNKEAGASLKNENLQAIQTELSPVHADLVAKWESYAILELASLPEFRLNPRSVAKALKIDASEAELLLKALFRANWLIEDSSGVRPNLRRSTTDPTDPRLNQARRTLMRSFLKKSAEAYEDLPPDARLHYGRTFCFDPSLLSAAAALIRRFGEDLHALPKEKNTEGRQIYQLQVSVYPVGTLEGLKATK